MAILMQTASPPTFAVALQYLSYYGDNVSAQHSWLSLAITQDGPTTDAFWNFKTPSLLQMPEDGIFARGTRSANGSQLTGGGMVVGWEGVLTSWAKATVIPRLANGTAIGVFVGDEICCESY